MIYNIPTIEERFNTFCLTCAPKEASATQIEGMRMCFMSGAMESTKLIETALQNLPKEQVVEVRNAMITDLRIFLQSTIKLSKFARKSRN